MKKYKDFYGCIALVKKENNGFRLKIRTARGKQFYNKVLKSESSCKQVMSRFSDGTMQEFK